MLLIILGVAMAFNIIVILMKLNRERYIDGLTDFAILVVFAIVLGGSAQSLAVGTIASCIISIYLFREEPKFLTQFKDNLVSDDEPSSDNTYKISL